MSDLQNNFNKFSTDNPKAILKRDFSKLEPEKADLWREQDGLWAKDRNELEEQLRTDRVEHITHFANQHASGERRLTPMGTQRETPILAAETIAMMKRGEREGLPFDQLTPESRHEEFIQKGYRTTLDFEQNEVQKFENERFEVLRRMMDNLLILDIADVRRDIDGNGRYGPDQALSHENDGRQWGEDGKNLSDEFDRHR